MTKQYKLGDEFTVDGVSYTSIRLNDAHYCNGANDEFYRRALGTDTYCEACPLVDPCGFGARELCGSGNDVRTLRTDLIPLFTLEGALK